MEDQLESFGELTLDRELDCFRAQWKEELKEQTTRSDSYSGFKLQSDDEKVTTYEQAEEFFLNGVWAEQNGMMYEAIEFYRQATKLVPDIEMKVEQHRRFIQNARIDEAINSDNNTCEIDDLTLHFSQNIDSTNHCEKAVAHSATHFLNLPTELVFYILHWVVSSNLDIVSLERFALVCRGFYLIARDPKIWQAICKKIWGVSCKTFLPHLSWRGMCIEKPHPLYNGVYINKVEFMRQGEATLDKFYPLWQKVTYYRYLRFFPDGLMFMHTSAHNPISVVGLLGDRHAQLEGMCRGIYRIKENRISCIMKRVKRKESRQIRKGKRNRNYEECENEITFLLDMIIHNHNQRNNGVLKWLKYACSVFYPETKSESTDEFRLTQQDYPPCYYSTVKSYSQIFHGPL